MRIAGKVSRYYIDASMNRATANHDWPMVATTMTGLFAICANASMAFSSLPSTPLLIGFPTRM